MTIEEAVPVSDPVAEAVGRLTEWVKPNVEIVLARIIQLYEQNTRDDTVNMNPARDYLASVLAKAGERIAELEKEEATLRGELGAIIMIFKAHGFATVKLPLSFAVSQQIDRAEAAEAQLAEARRVMEPFARWWQLAGHYGDEALKEVEVEVARTHGDVLRADLRSAYFEAAYDFLASQPVPDPTLPEPEKKL